VRHAAGYIAAEAIDQVVGWAIGGLVIARFVPGVPARAV
jgi:hypothetical protein